MIDDWWLMMNDWWLMMHDWWLEIDDWWLTIDDRWLPRYHGTVVPWYHGAMVPLSAASSRVLDSPLGANTNWKVVWNIFRFWKSWKASEVPKSRNKTLWQNMGFEIWGCCYKTGFEKTICKNDDKILNTMMSSCFLIIQDPRRWKRNNQTWIKL